jgi:sugar transferase (PEP-CTERM/EpsH1 system associated)
VNVLFVCHRFPFPPTRGGKIRPFNMIKHLSSQGHEVTVASLVRSDEEMREGQGLSEYCADYLMEKVSRHASLGRMVARLPSSVPSSMGYFYSPRLARRIREALQERHFDLIFVHCSSVAQYVEHVRDIPKILDYGDMDSQKWLLYSQERRFPLSVGYFIEGVKLKRAEMALSRRFDICTCTTKAEMDTLQSYGTASRTAWMPNGVDTDFFCSSPNPYDENRICFIGRMDYFPNQQCMLEFCEEVLPIIHRRRPAAKLTIVGANPPPSIEKLERRPGVEVTGSVPDVRPYVQRAAVTVAPLRIARGTQNKILESMAMGVPVVASEQAAKGVDAVPGEHLLTSSTAQLLAENVLKLLDNRDERQRLSVAGQERVRTHHSWQASMERLDAIIADCLSMKTETSTSMTSP